MKLLLIDKNLLDPMHRAKWCSLAKRPGVELTAICPDRWVENFRPQSFAPRGDDGFPIEAHPVVWPGYENRSFYSEGLGGAIRQARPDVIIAFEEPFSLFALQATLGAGFSQHRPLLVVHSWDNLAHGRHFGYRPAFAYAAIERLVARRAALIWTANEEGRASFAKRYATPVRHLPFGLDLSAFSPAVGPRSDDFRIGYVGRLLPMKGIDNLLHASARLSFPHQLEILGSGPDRDRLTRLAESLGLTGRMTLREAVPSHEVPRLMANLSLLVLPSLTTPVWKEQFGRVLVEAMAAGVPVIGSSSGAIPEVIGNAGVIVHEGDSAALAEAIEILHAEPSRLIAMRENGLARALEYTAERFAEHVNVDLQAVLAES